MMQASAHHSHSESLDTGADEAEASEGVEPSAGARSVIFAIITLLAHAHQHASALAKCILPAVERSCLHAQLLQDIHDLAIPLAFSLGHGFMHLNC